MAPAPETLEGAWSADLDAHLQLEARAPYRVKSASPAWCSVHGLTSAMELLYDVALLDAQGRICILDNVMCA